MRWDINNRDKNVLVLGAGNIGQVIAKCLADDGLSVAVVDADPNKLSKINSWDIGWIQTFQFDFNSDDLKDLINDIKFLVIVGAMPGDISFEISKKMIIWQVPIVDISFFNEDPFALSGLAELYKVPVIVDMGLAPGMSNLLLGFEDSRHPDIRVKSFSCVVGGLPINRRMPWQYQASFSVSSVVDEYTRPARVMEEGLVKIIPALTDLGIINFSGIGDLEVLATDGLRTLLTTMKHIPNMSEATLRYPGHGHLINLLKQCGFFAQEPLKIKGVGSTISPLEVSKAVLDTSKVLMVEPTPLI